ncbi:MAG: hypothetical protein ACPGXY_02690 [Alphaproteobacteria bacterium]
MSANNSTTLSRHIRAEPKPDPRTAISYGVGSTVVVHKPINENRPPFKVVIRWILAWGGFAALASSLLWLL